MSMNKDQVKGRVSVVGCAFSAALFSMPSLAQGTDIALTTK